MPSSMLNLNRLQLFHLGQVREHPILKNAKQHQTVTICVRYESNQFWRISSSMLKLSRLQIFHLGQVSEQPILRNANSMLKHSRLQLYWPGSGTRKGSKPFRGMPCSMQKLSRLQLFHLGQIKEQPHLRNVKQHAQAQQIVTISPGSGHRVTNSEECQAACTSSAGCNYFTWVRYASNPF